MNRSWQALRGAGPTVKALVLTLLISAALLLLGVPVHILLTITVMFTFFPELVFIIVYHRMYDWASNEIGQTLMFKSVGMAGVLLLSSGRSLFGDYPYREHLVFVFFLAVAVSITFRIPALLKDRMAGGSVRRPTDIPDTRDTINDN